MNAVELCAMLGENTDMSIGKLSESQQAAIEQWKLESEALNAAMAIAEPMDPKELAS